MRLNRFLSLCGLGSRRGCEDLILQGRVVINGSVVNELATNVADKDDVIVDGRQARPNKSVVLVLNKPKGYLCTREDTHDRATIYDLLPARYQQLHHVGRLDKDSEGLILLTNRGDLSQRLLHPSEGVEKEYEVRLETEFDPTDVPKLIHGVHTAEGFARAERVYIDSVWKVNVVLKQGLKRQIRLMFFQIGYEVERLVRTRIGGLKLYGLPKGGWKELTESEVERYFFAPMRGAAKAKAKTEPPAENSDDLAPRRSQVRKTPGAAKPRRPGGVRSASGPSRARKSASAADAKKRAPHAKSSASGKPKPPVAPRKGAFSERVENPSPARKPTGPQKRAVARDAFTEREDKPAGARKRFAVNKGRSAGPPKRAPSKGPSKPPRRAAGKRPSGRRPE